MEAALRPTMRFVEPKTGEQQARAIVFRTREQFVNQRTEAINALRSHLYEFGYVAPQGIGNLPRLEEVIEDPSSDLPQVARDICRRGRDPPRSAPGQAGASCRAKLRQIPPRRSAPASAGPGSSTP